MGKPRLQLEAIIDTESHADTIISSIRNKLIGKDIFEEHNLSKGNEEGIISINFDFRFNQRLDRDDVLDWLKDQIRNHPQVKTWVKSATIKSHLCTHDDPEVKSCKTTEYVEWVN